MRLSCDKSLYEEFISMTCKVERNENCLYSLLPIPRFLMLNLLYHHQFANFLAGKSGIITYDHYHPVISSSQFIAADGNPV